MTLKLHPSDRSPTYRRIAIRIASKAFGTEEEYTEKLISSFHRRKGAYEKAEKPEGYLAVYVKTWIFVFRPPPIKDVSFRVDFPWFDRSDKEY